ncbi:hypothetical protein AB4Z50_25955 [Paenibacillus sp. 2TAB26]|uniref:hypothetical protein n=1 Tax=Paenibacillus sp. 2TAB26 TaxID=3233005 RepID=UPI003F97F0C5
MDDTSTEKNDKTNNWGGARLGAGRKDGLKKQKRKRVLSLFLTDAQWTALEKEVIEEKEKLSSLVNKKLESYANDLIVKHGVFETIKNENKDKNGE